MHILNPALEKTLNMAIYLKWLQLVNITI